MKQVFLTTALICTTYMLNAQLGYGFTVSNDIYSWYQNPESIGPNEELLDVHEGNGSLLLNLGMGPKIWIGAPKFSFSLEAQAKIGLFGLAVKDFKGLGNHSIPVVGRLNFGGLSGLDKEGKFGWSIGGGVQWNKTELFYTLNDYTLLGVDRNYFKTYVGQVAYGFGLSGFTIHAVLGVGYNPDTEARSFNFGLQYDFNLPKLKKISNPESEL
ncbi:MAG: hypothetical protein P8H42_06070 [Saprospiraceae bacterium]|nr:hypothetical protein [Saprospiraceae bacterium]